MRWKLRIDFEKWHGNGNDFVIVNSVENKLKVKKDFIRKAIIFRIYKSKRNKRLVNQYHSLRTH